MKKNNNFFKPNKFRMAMTPKCDNCGNKEFIREDDELPAMLGFQTKDGKVINVCRNCLIKLGAMSDEEKAEFFKKLGAE